MSAAPSWPLISSPAPGAPSGTRLPPLPGLNFFEPALGVRNSVSGCHVLNLFFKPSKRKTTRGAHGHARPSLRSLSRTAKARNSLLSQRLTGKYDIPAHRAFVLSTRYGATIVQIRGVNPPIPTLFRVRPAPGRSVARLLHPPPLLGGCPSPRGSAGGPPGLPPVSVAYLSST